MWRIASFFFCAKTVTVCIDVGCWRGACTPCLSFIFQNLPLGAPCYLHISVEWFLSQRWSLFSHPFLFHSILFFVGHWYHHVTPCSWSLFGMCEWLVLAWDTFSVHTSVSLCVSEHNSSATFFKLCELMKPSCLSLSAFIVELSCTLQTQMFGATTQNGFTPQRSE